MRLGHYPAALDHFRQNLVAVQELGDPWLEAVGRASLGQAYQRLDRCQDALDQLQQALAVFREVDDPYNEANVRSVLGVTCSQLGRHQEALDHHRHALAILRDIGGDRHSEADILNDMGTSMRHLGSPLESIERHREALNCAEAIGDRSEQGHAHDGIAQAYHTMGDIQHARIHWQQALTLYADLGTLEAEQITANLEALDNTTARATLIQQTETTNEPPIE